MNEDNKPRDGGAVNPVDTPKLETVTSSFKDCTLTRCDLQARGEIAEVLFGDKKMEVCSNKTYTANTAVVGWQSKVERPSGRRSQVINELSGPRRSHSLTLPSKLERRQIEMRKFAACAPCREELRPRCWMPPDVLDPGLVLDEFSDHGVFLFHAPVKEFHFAIGETRSEYLGGFHVADYGGDRAVRVGVQILERV
jgi:hypothetical protein